MRLAQIITNSQLSNPMQGLSNICVETPCVETPCVNKTIANNSDVAVGTGVASFPGLCMGREKRAWYTLFAHAQ